MMNNDVLLYSQCILLQKGNYTAYIKLLGIN